MSGPDRIRQAYARREQSVDLAKYSLERPGNRLALQERQHFLMKGMAQRSVQGLHGLEILEIGCGVGGELEWLVALGAEPDRLHGIDLREEAVSKARERAPGAHLVIGDASNLPFPDGAMDVVYQATALSSMPSREMRVRVAAEMIRATRPGGMIVSYDFAWNPANRDTVGIGTRELRRLFPGLPLEVHRVTLVPPLARWLGDRSERALRIAAGIAILRSHRLAIVDVPR
jgi:SAM-dependent methyltransferase